MRRTENLDPTRATFLGEVSAVRALPTAVHQHPATHKIVQSGTPVVQNDAYPAAYACLQLDNLTHALTSYVIKFCFDYLILAFMKQFWLVVLLFIAIPPRSLRPALEAKCPKNPHDHGGFKRAQ
jgi:hypothetical protein